MAKSVRGGTAYDGLAAVEMGDAGGVGSGVESGCCCAAENPEQWRIRSFN